MIRNGKALLQDAPIAEMLTKKHRHNDDPKGISYGLTECGYDIRIKQGRLLMPGIRFRLASSIERFQMPMHLMGRVLNKSTWARKGLDASMTTNIEPGWCGYLTIELHYRGYLPLWIPPDVGICQVIFETLEEQACYQGKYANQPDHPVEAIFGDTP